MAAPPKKLIIVVDDHPYVREALGRLVATLHRHTTVYTAASPVELQPLVERHLVEAGELLMAEISLPADLNVTSDDNAANAPLMVVSTEQHGIAASWFVALGDDKPDPVDSAGIEVALDQHKAVLELIRTLRDPSGKGQKELLGSKDVPAVEDLMRLGLTQRQAEVLQLVAQGLTNKEIARRLDVSEWTVRHHVSSVLERLEVSNRGRAATFAHQFTGAGE